MQRGKSETRDSISDDAPTGDRVSAMTSDPPPTFMEDDIQLWFLLLERYFATQRITCQDRRFDKTLRALPTAALHRLADILTDTPPNTYDHLKTRLLAEYEATTKAKITRLVGGCELGDRKPSVLLREMRKLASNQGSVEKSVMDLMQLNDVSGTAPGSKNPPYVSLIKINGKPIIPPLIDEDRRKELQIFKQKAIELELKLEKKKKQNLKQITCEVSTARNINESTSTRPVHESTSTRPVQESTSGRPVHESTPIRPATLNLAGKAIGKMFLLSKSRTESSLNKYSNSLPLDFEIISSHKSAKNLDKAFRSTLEQRLASEDDIIVRNKLNKCQQSPVGEECLAEKLTDSDRESVREKQIWSPLQIDSINSLKIELPTKDTQEVDDNLEVSLDESQNTPDTVTHSPSLMRQNSYTLLTPSPALLQFLESQRGEDRIPRSQSGRKTWDLRKAKKNWDPNNEGLGKSSDEECDAQCLNKKNSSSLDSLSAALNNSSNGPDYCEYSLPNSLAYDSGTSPESYNSKKTAPKVKCRPRGKKPRSTRSVPSPDSAAKVPFKDHKKPTQGSNNFSGPEISDLSNLLLKMKVDFERQKRELEEKQQSEMKKLEIIFQRKEAELLNKITSLPKKITKSIYTQSSRESYHQEGTPEFDPRTVGDQYRKENAENCSHQYGHGKRPHSAKDFHPQNCSYDSDWNRRTRSMDYNQGNQDTDLDVSFQDDFIQSKDTTLNNEYIIESDSISNFSSHSSTVSSDNRHDLAQVRNLKKFQGISSEEYAKYNQAAARITAAARGFLTRRLYRTAHVQGLITTLRDAINCATQLHAAPDIADSDIDLMRRLGRQIEAAWDAVYAVFFNTDTTTKLQLIAADRERLRAATAKTSIPTVKKKRISLATKKSLDRKKGGSVMSKSQTSNGFSRARTCTKMTASYPSPYFPQKLK